MKKSNIHSIGDARDRKNTTLDERIAEVVDYFTREHQHLQEEVDRLRIRIASLEANQ